MRDVLFVGGTEEDGNYVVKVVAAASLDDAYVRRLEREKYLALAVVAFLTLVGFLGLLLNIGQPTYPDLISNFLYPLASFVGATWAFLTAFRIARNLPRLDFRYRLAWLLVGSGLLANCFGSLYYTYAERSGIAGEGTSFSIQLRTPDDASLM